MTDIYINFIISNMIQNKEENYFGFSLMNYILESFPETFHIIFYILMFLIIDMTLLQLFLNKARWFALHTIGNAFVIYYTLPILIKVVTNPIEGFKLDADYMPLNITVALHIYHMLFYKNLPQIDWIHHILMTGIALFSYTCPSCIIVCTNCLLFFINGLPGGIDYAMLVLVKYEYMESILEKKLNSYLNILIRSPGILVGTYIMYLTTIFSNYNPNFIIKLMGLIILFWNAQYFTYRVIGNYHIKQTEYKFEHIDDSLKRYNSDESQGINKKYNREFDIINKVNKVNKIGFGKSSII